MEKKYRILVVDDEDDLRQILQFNLENEGYEVDTANSGEQALKILNKNHALILLDVMMEKMSGYQTAEYIRNELKFTVPIIFLTARTTENDLLTGFSLGADDYVTKPFSIKELNARVKSILQRAYPTGKSEEFVEKVNIENLQVDLVKKSVKSDGEEVQLTKKEFEILVLLLTYPNRVFSREEFLEQVWPEDGFVLDRTVDVHITRLRKKIGVYGKRIINRSGYGYYFEA